MGILGFYSMGLVGYEIHKIENEAGEEYVTWLYVGTQREQRARKSKVQYTAKGRAFFIAHGKRIHLDECMRS
jgi:hypothetical protein